MAEVKGFTFSESYYTTISDPENGLSEDQKAQLYKAMIEYIFVGKIPSFRGVLKIVFTALLPSLEKSKVRSKAKRNKIKFETNKNQTEIKTKTNENQNEDKTGTKNNFDFQKEEKEIPLKESSKENISSEKEEILSLSTPYNPPAQEMFLREYPLVIDNYNPSVLSSLTDEDWKKITEQFQASAWLRKNVTTLSRLCSMATNIVAGSHAPFEKVCAQDEESLSGEERRKNAEWFDKMFRQGE